MGIAVKELLTLEYFKDYHVIAGKSGLHKEIQGTTLLEAPDALRWAKGKELFWATTSAVRRWTAAPPATAVLPATRWKRPSSTRAAALWQNLPPSWT